MTASMVLVIPIVPTAQMRARACVRGFGAKAHASTYKDTAQEDREQTIRAFLAQHVPAVPFDGPVELGVRAYLPIPASKSQRWRAEAAAGRIRPVVKPDLDNLVKQVKDCLTQMLYWTDDKIVVGYLPGVGKYYSDRPRWEIEIRPWAPAQGLLG